jgi:hypothetical protein
MGGAGSVSAPVLAEAAADVADTLPAPPMNNPD